MILLYWFLCFICYLNELELDVNLLYVQYGYIKCILWMKCFNRGINKNMQFKGSGYKTANTNTVYTSFHKVYGMVKKVCKCTYRLPYNPLLINCHFLFIWTRQTMSIWDILYMTQWSVKARSNPLLLIVTPLLVFDEVHLGGVGVHGLQVHLPTPEHIDGIV